jgi:hypothetical protein
MRRLLAALSMLLLVGSSGLTAGAQAYVPERTSGTDFDTFDAVTLNAVDGNGTEIPQLDADQLDAGPFDTSTFTVQAGESGTTNNVNGCARADGSGFDFAGRTAWVRFDPGVAGTIAVRAFTPGYDSVLAVREATQAPWHLTQLADLPGHNVDCSNSTSGPGDEAVGYCAVPNPECHGFPVEAQFAYYVQVGGKCPGGPETCSDPSVPGGPTTIRLTFVPDDADGDGVPDTLDECSGTPPGTQVNAAGCPDQDGDGIADADDDCPAQPGVEAEPPYNGCPAGPVPPTPDGARVVIRSTDGNPDNTSTTDVLLSLNWPKGARRAFANNGAGDPDVEIPLVGTPVPWELRPASKSEARQVNVTYRGPGIDESATDIITLDPIAPRVTRSLALHSSEGWYVGLKMADDLAGSGMKRVVLLDQDRQKLAARRFCSAARAGRDAESRDGCSRVRQSRFLVPRPRPRFADVFDAAGNVRRTKIVYRDDGCKIKVVESENYYQFKCFQVGDRCGAVRTKYDWDLSNLACRKIHDRGYRVVKLT